MKHWTLSKSQLMFPKLSYLQTSLRVCTGHAQVVLVKQTIDRLNLLIRDQKTRRSSIKKDLAQIQAWYTFGIGDNRWRDCKKVGRLFIQPGHGTF